ncbi:MAG: hypothetical protein BWY04_01416 [candidate division CPR1 bacterium ADurb.Bin160]|uniref:DUF2493 domain-containing protein n=1 Tax=candidate division CPR1 bacterium ADurb.Bin160 TaxID=1852826 RepID=A0A1V5ZJ52_9BACT|nr:MAG: hypothetical protein BWY04_01416 [candidate division CPR1 bacterium ADurb.Bin160]
MSVKYKIAIVGSRVYGGSGKYNDFVKYMDHYIPDVSIIDYLISGGTYGIDTYAEWYAKEKNVKMKVILPEWKKYGKSAGFKRNMQIINEADIIFAFWDGKSKGTLHDINIAKNFNKEITIIKTL